MLEGFTRMGDISMDKDGNWLVTYMSFATGEATLQRAQGTQLAALVSGLEKNKEKYKEHLKEE